jgi:hypothetical protein
MKATLKQTTRFAVMNLSFISPPGYRGEFPMSRADIILHRTPGFLPYLGDKKSRGMKR